jgi:hypothetical protein
VVTALGITQIFAWGCSYYLPAVLAKPIAEGTGRSLAWVVGGLSLGLVVAGVISPIVGRSIHRHGGRPVLIASSIFFATGLLLIALGQNIEVYLAGWIIIGLGMGGALRRGICDSGTDISRGRQKRDLATHVIRWILEHHLLASQLVACRNDRLANHLLSLRGFAGHYEFANLHTASTRKRRYRIKKT